jgi:hypothetical protein
MRLADACWPARRYYRSAVLLPVLIAAWMLCTHTAVSVSAPRARPRKNAALRCLRGLAKSEPWFAVYGDSITRGLYFDLLQLLNGTASALVGPPHPGHSANHSVACARFEARPPTNRSKCAAFEYSAPLDDSAGHVLPLLHGQPRPLASPLRLSFQLKTFGWEPRFDRAWLAALRREPRPPDLLLLGFGLWDMQYPPGDNPAAGLVAFHTAVLRFLEELRRVLPASAWRVGGTPRVFWLTLTAVASEQLPAWKRPRMNASLARSYNELAGHEMRAAGIGVIDTFGSTLGQSALTADGVHFPALSPRHLQALLAAACPRRERGMR